MCDNNENAKEKDVLTSKDINKFGTIYHKDEIPEGINLNSYDEVVRACLKTLHQEEYDNL